MRIIRGIKIGGLQNKIFNLVLIFILLLMGVYSAVTAWHQRNLSTIVEDAGALQQQSIVDVSQETMEAVLDTSMRRITGLQAYIADDLFGDVRTDVMTLQAFATELFENAGSFTPRYVFIPSAVNEGVPSAQLIHEDGVNPQNSHSLGLMANMSEVMLAMYQNSDAMSSCFVGTADGNMILVNDRPGVFLSEDGTPLNLDIRNRPWYVQAAEAGELIFTGVEIDAYTDNPMLECAAPVYQYGRLMAVVAADVYLTSISDYIESTASEEGFVCVINGNGQMLFSPKGSGLLKAQLSSDAPDLRACGNAEFAGFVTRALEGSTELEVISVDGKSYYMSASPMPSLGWTVISMVDKAVTLQPARVMLARYDDINAKSLKTYTEGSRHSMQTLIVLTAAVVVLAIAGALVMSSRVVKPLERMTQRINTMHGADSVFAMEDAYRTGDEIEVLAESFATLSKRAKDYIAQITEITAEKERISTELSLATRIQADMLPNIYPAFPDRPEFDIYASMDPAKEVGGDFYDFFLVDDDHLCMVMADVSGKGVPAALFMMASRIILANNAMMGKSPGQILTDTNAAICSNNREEMFVTVWLGILEISTGKLVAANAGHEYPVILQPGGRFELLRDKHGFVIGGMDGVRYKEYELTLAPGAKIFLYTDGVPEATDAGNTLFGTDRMLDALNTATGDTPEEILRKVRAAVDGFVGDAEQFDDLTMLCAHYIGPDGKTGSEGTGVTGR